MPQLCLVVLPFFLMADWRAAQPIWVLHPFSGSPCEEQRLAFAGTYTAGRRRAAGTPALGGGPGNPQAGGHATAAEALVGMRGRASFFLRSQLDPSMHS